MSVTAASFFNRYTELRVVDPADVGAIGPFQPGQEPTGEIVVAESLKFIGGFPTRQFDIHFAVEGNSKKSGDSARVTVWNLDDDTISRLQAGNLIVVRSGYKPTVNSEFVSNVYSGKIVRAETKRVGGDAETVISCADVSSTLKFFSPAEERTYQPGIRWSDIVRDLVELGKDHTGVVLGNLDNSDNGPEEAFAIDITASLWTEIQRTAAKATINNVPMTLTVYQGSIYLTEKPFFPGEGYKLTYQTGLLEIHQEHESEGGIKKTGEPVRYSIESLLIPFITKGTIIRIKDTKEVVDTHFEVISYKFMSDDSKHIFTAIIRAIEVEEVVE